MPFVFARFTRLREKIEPHFDFYCSILLALAAFAVYVRTLTPGVLDGDSGEWQYMANILGVPHSTGYPLYILLAKVVTFLPLGNPAWRVNLFSAICAALTIPVVYFLAKRLAHSRSAAIISASFFALMPTLWASATIAEVYALNTLLVALTLFFAVRFFDGGRTGDLLGMAWCFGLALTNHRIAFFIAPALLLVVWLKRATLNWRKFGLGALAFLLPLALYLYIPLRASQLLAVQSPENWELYPRAEAIVNGRVTAYYNPTPAGFFNLVTALDNRNKLGFESADGENQTLARFENAWNLLREQIDPFGIALAVLGVGIAFRRERALTMVLLIAGTSVAAVSIVLRAESTRFYFSGAYLVMLLFFAAGIGWILNTLAARARETGSLETAPVSAANRFLPRALYYAAIVYFAFFPLTALYFNFARMDASGNTRYEAYARSILNDDLAQNAVLIAPWEVATPIRYFQFVEGVRPDILTIHESPVRPQYQKLLDAAHRLHRPFYYAQFSPEDKNSIEAASAPGERTIQAIAFPLPEKPHFQNPLDVELNDSVRAIGYSWTQTGRTARLAIFYEVVKPTRIEYVSETEVSGPQEETRAFWSRHPVSDYYPTYLWKQGEFYRDVYDVTLDHTSPGGDYVADITWFDYDSVTGKRDEASAKSFRLSGLRVGN